jgi:hypothetical protein
MWETIAWIVIIGIFGFVSGILVCTGFVLYLINLEVDEQ